MCRKCGASHDVDGPLPTDDRPTIDRDALRAEGGDVREWVERDLDLLDPRKATPGMVADLIAMVRDRQHRLDAETRRADKWREDWRHSDRLRGEAEVRAAAETRRADAAGAEVARLRQFGVALTVSAERDAARAERDSLGERIAELEAKTETCPFDCDSCRED
jgi:hypothetical protein